MRSISISAQVLFGKKNPMLKIALFLYFVMVFSPWRAVLLAVVGIAPFRITLVCDRVL
jgi:hypothetical protein